MNFEQAYQRKKIFIANYQKRNLQEILVSLK